MNVVPAIAGSMLSVFVIERSADVVIPVGSVAELFSRFGSGVVADTVAVFDVLVSVLLAGIETVITIVADAPLTRLPTVHTPPTYAPPESSDTYDTSGGNRSETETPVASDGPLFVTWIV